jgi:hypothetical protein
MADEVLRVAEAVLDNRQLTLRQVQALARGSLKIDAGYQFRRVAVSDVELARFRAENDAQASRGPSSGVDGRRAARE